MSVDVVFQSCRFDGTKDVRTNPFTREPCLVSRRLPISEVELDAVVEVLRRAGAAGPDAGGGFRLEAPNADVMPFDLAGFMGEELRYGCLLQIDSPWVTPAIAELLFAIMAAGNWVIVAENRTLIAPNLECVTDGLKPFVDESGGNLASVFSRHTGWQIEDIAVAASAQELETLLLPNEDG